MAVRHLAQRGGFDDFDLIAPHIEMPRHLQHASGLEANGQRSIFAVC